MHGRRRRVRRPLKRRSIVSSWRWAETWRSSPKVKRGGDSPKAEGEAASDEEARIGKVVFASDKATLN
jgi:hypothetical protein